MSVSYIYQSSLLRSTGDDDHKSNYLLKHILKFLGWLIAKCSDATLDRVAAGLATIFFDLLGLRRGVILKNLEIAFPQESAAKRHEIGRLSYKNFLFTIFEFLRSPFIDIIQGVEFKGREHLENALAQGKGVYILCCHMGNWEMMGAAITRRICPAHVLVKRVGRGSTGAYVSDLRAHNGFLEIKRQKKGDGYAAIKQVLEKGEIVGFVADHSRPGEPFIEFFGKPAKTNTSLAGIAGKVPAPILPSSGYRTGFGRQVVEFFPVLDLPSIDDDKERVLTWSKMCNEMIETMIKKAPEQYFWMHDRWKQ